MGFLIAEKVDGKSTKWPKGTLPFEIDEKVFVPNERMHQMILSAMERWQEQTGMIFKEREEEEDYVLFTKGETCCQSPVGFQGGKQLILCDVEEGFSVGSVMHEIGHAVGFYDEHQRKDSQDYVSLRKENVDPQIAEAWSQQKEGVLATPYDLGSLMHPADEAFTIEKGKKTLVPKKRMDGIQLGQRDALSAWDLATLHVRYKNWRLHRKDRYYKGRFLLAKKEELMIIQEREEGVLAGFFLSSERGLEGFVKKQKYIGKSSNTWEMAQGDHYYVGQFSGEPLDELLVFNASSPPKVGYLALKKGVPTCLWKKEKALGEYPKNWMLATSDRRLVGKFLSESQDSLLLLSAGSPAWAAFVHWSGKELDCLWRKEKSLGDFPHSWLLQTGDQHVVGDFDGNGKDEVLFIHRASSVTLGLGFWAEKEWSMAVKVQDQIGDIPSAWELQPSDRLICGRFASKEKETILIFSSQSPVWSGLIEWTGTEFACSWRKEKSIGDWKLSAEDQFIVGDFDGDGFDEVIVYHFSTKSKFAVLKWSGGELQCVWKGEKRIGDKQFFWSWSYKDHWEVGRFISGQKEEIFFFNDETPQSLALVRFDGRQLQCLWKGEGALSSY